MELPDIPEIILEGIFLLFIPLITVKSHRAVYFSNEILVEIKKVYFLLL